MTVQAIDMLIDQVNLSRVGIGCDLELVLEDVGEIPNIVSTFNKGSGGFILYAASFGNTYIFCWGEDSDKCNSWLDSH